MNNTLIWIIICLASLIFGVLHYKAKYYIDINKQNNYFKFLEFWHHSINYFIAFVAAYYLIAFRWPDIQSSKNLSTQDFIIGIVFLMGIFGWIPYFVKNITEGISVIFRKILDK